MTRRAFTFGLLFAMREQGESVNTVIAQIEKDGRESPDDVARQINEAAREYIKLQAFAEKRRKFFVEWNDAPLISTYEKMATLHEKFAALFRKLAESLRG